MDNRMLERIVIIILLLLNLFLLGVVLTDRAEICRGDRETAEYVTEILNKNGVSIDEKTVSLQAAPAGRVLIRSSAKERTLVRGLLGRSFSADDLGGNILFYRSEQGQAVFRGSGETEVLFDLDAIRLRGSAEKTAARLLRRMDLEAELCDAGINPADGEAYAEFFCCLDGYPVYNAKLHVDFAGESVYMLTGTRVFDEPAEENADGLMDSVSALLRFAELLQNGEFSCTRVDGFRAGYLNSTLVSGESTLTPVWRLETDGGVLLINAENGRIESGTT